jgi:hypothetical protein
MVSREKHKAEVMLGRRLGDGMLAGELIPHYSITFKTQSEHMFLQCGCKHIHSSKSESLSGT